MRTKFLAEDHITTLLYLFTYKYLNSYYRFIQGFLLI